MAESRPPGPDRSGRPAAPLLLRARDLGSHDDPGPRRLPAPVGPVRWGRPVLLPLSSAMRAVTPDPVLALTYDDGPDAEHTPGVLDVLARRGIRATFFVLAGAAERHPELTRRILAGGHEIGLHGLDHTLLTTVAPWQAARAVRVSHRRLEAVTGIRVRMYRPTYGIQGWAQFLTARALGMDVVYWTAWAQDWLDDPARQIAARAVAASHPGGVLLLHDTTGDADTSGLPVPCFSRAEVTDLVLTGLFAEGYDVLPVGELLSRYPQVRAVTLARPRIGRPGRRSSPDVPASPV